MKKGTYSDGGSIGCDIIGAMLENARVSRCGVHNKYFNAPKATCVLHRSTVNCTLHTL